jgi:hypothetical protein
MTPNINRRDASPPIISLNTHNIVDYVLGVVLVFSPYVFGFSDLYAAKNVFLVLGFGLLGYSLITQYKYSVLKILPLGPHMALDVVLGIVLMLAPSVFSYAPLLTGFQYAWHFICGIGAIGLVALTRPKTNRAMVVDEMDRDIEIDRAA